MRVIYKLLIIVACCIPVQAFAVEKLSVSELLDRYAANQDKLKSFVAKTESVSTRLPQDAPAQQAKMRRTMVEFRYEESGSDLKVYYWFRYDLNRGEDGIWVPADRCHSVLWDGKLCYDYYRAPVLDYSKLYVISDEDYIKQAIAIGYEGAGPILGILYGDLERFDLILRQSDTISVHSELEQVGSADCYVIDAKSEHGTYAIWLDPEHGYGIARAVVHKGPEDLLHGRQPSSYINAESYKGRSFFMENVRFENIEGVWVPMEADYRIVSERKNSTSTMHSHHKISQININPNHAQLQSFVLDVQNGTRIRIIDEPRFEYSWHDGKKFVVDEWDGGIRYVPKDWSILVGVGKPLPKLGGIKLRLSAQQTKDRAILLCFFDMEQRLSRDCLTQLAQKAEELNEKGVTIAAIQTSQVTEKTLNEWTKKNNIPFPLGMITADIEKTRFTWGIRSLPWLILTDRDHIVRDGGFGIDELDGELKKNIDTEHAIQKNKATPIKPVAQTDLSDPAKSFLDAEAILAGWRSTYESIKSMRVLYSHRLLDYKPPTNKPDAPAPVAYSYIERVEEGKRYHMRYSSAEDTFDRPGSLAEHAFDGRVTRGYFGVEKSGSIVPGLTGKAPEVTNYLKDYMLMNTERVRKYLNEYPDGIPKFVRLFRRYMSSATIRTNLESVAGQLCHVVEFSSAGPYHDGKYILWVAHDRGMCLMRYRAVHNLNKIKIENQIEVEQIAMAKTDNGAIWYPVKAYKTAVTTAEDGAYAEDGAWKYELIVKEFVPNVKVDENTFRFDFPKGTYVFDRVRGVAGTDLPKEPPSLVGKPLPQLKDFNHKIDVNQTKDRMILVCFFDMEQRPSRNCIRELAKRAKQLKQKGVTGVAVQASKIDENTLNEWVKNYNIPFPVGMGQGDEERTRFTWGIRSLPWMILTDKQHVVTAEGFNPAELNEKLGNNPKHKSGPTR